MRDRLPIAEKSAVELDEMKGYIKTLKQNKSLDPDRIKTKIYQGIFDIAAYTSDPNNNDCFQREYFPTQHKKSELSLIYKSRDKNPQDAKSYRRICLSIQ